MKDIILKAENISKQYRLGQVGTGTLTHDINRWWHQIRGKENPYLKIGDTNDRSTKGNSDYVWALQDINFEVKRGEVLGIIGKNGAGKSTLLKILSKVTAPTTGTIKCRGRIASLLEVGTGFNGEMTGRENIFLNGAILGMTKKEIASKLDEIIDFSGCERYIDTPVKRYSSGMTVRLAFAVAAFLEPEVLVVDEVLAVGDAEFQKKAIGKMQDISKSGGRTVLFVSHNMVAVKQLCNRGIVMEHGKVKYDGNIDDALAKYLEINSGDENSHKIIYKVDESKEAQILSVELRNENEHEITEFFTDQDIYIHITLRNNSYEENLRLNFSILDKYENLIFINRRALDFTGVKKWILKVPNNALIANTYIIGLALDIPKIKLLDFPQNKLGLNIINLTQEEFKDGDVENGFFKIPVEWKM
ncbi:ABC transporter ATP-binding protein [Flavobacterium fluviatile]|uniref:ABC transporter ATP-binding protein n=1 Tax=Flavobacterium fluviatile TaxID=1862387 RepID=UPI0013D45E0B|nr:ABC transporter ATP-binding protein [Flavobacterium fluviatile]